jgi:IgA Peptidase M64
MKLAGLRTYVALCLLALGWLACSSNDTASGGAPGTAGNLGASGATTGNGTSSGGGGEGTGGAVAAAGMGGSGRTADGGLVGGGPVTEMNPSTLAANTTVGLEWNAVAGAGSYNIYWSMSAGVAPATGQKVTLDSPNWVHRGLTNGTAYHYVVTATIGGMESAPSEEVTGTPAGEWALEEFGTGIIEDVRTGSPTARVPLAKRIHVLLFAEGYLEAELASALHSVASHDGTRRNDVDRWTDLVFSIEPYKAYRKAFVVWYLPRPSNAHVGGDTAFAVPADTAGVGSVGTETATRAWQAVATFPFPPTDFNGPSSGSARNIVASFLMLDPDRGQAGVSGRSTSLSNPASNSQRLSAAFGVGLAHEFTHAFSSLRDEYIDNSNMASNTTSNTSNVVPTSVCSELPWQHLLVGGAYNPSRDQLVGAFGRPQQGYHPELLCLLNGTHDNAAYYGGSGLLRVEDRLCNFCREITAFRVYQRSGLIAGGNAGFDAWTAEYRAPFFKRFPFFVPAVVPQTNNVRTPSQGMPYYEACTAQTMAVEPLAQEGEAETGCIIEPL